MARMAFLPLFGSGNEVKGALWGGLAESSVLFQTEKLK
jgi:hypothetical protein